MRQFEPDQNLVKIRRRDNEDSPIKDVIASYNLHAENLNEFDIAKVLDWDSNNMKQYK